jgi:hypothetical protein
VRGASPSLLKGRTIAGTRKCTQLKLTELLAWQRQRKPDNGQKLCDAEREQVQRAVPSLKILTYCIMKFRMDFLHCALITIVVLLAVYFRGGSGGFRGGAILEGGQFYGVTQHEEASSSPPPVHLSYGT